MLIAHVPHFYKNISNMNITHDTVHIFGRSPNSHEFTYENYEPMPDSLPTPKYPFLLILKK